MKNTKKLYIVAFTLLLSNALPGVTHAQSWESVEPLLATADAVAGKQQAQICTACHSFDKGGANKIGPNLYGIVNKAPAKAAGFAYSDGMKSIQGKKWTYDALDHFIFDPKSYVAGTKMLFAGVKDRKKRADIIAWLNGLSDSPAPLPKSKK